MDEIDARRFTLIRALEECDSEGVLLPLASRQAATREAGPPADSVLRPDDPAGSAFLGRRAQILHEQLETTHPELARLARPFPWRAWMVTGTTVLAWLAGYAAAEIGPAQRLNLLSFPLLGLLLWNIAFYALLAGTAVFGRSARGKVDPVLPGWPQLWRRSLRHRSAATPAERTAVAFTRAWTARVAALRWAEMRQALHVGAAAMAAGLIAGLYVRGLALEYRAGWESTFIDAATLESLLHLVFGPASWLTGIPLPDAAALQGLAWSSGGNGENAAPWIHLAAVTAVLFIIAPRLLLAGAAGRRAARRRRELPAYSLDSYTRPLLQAGRTGAGRVMLAPLGYRPSERFLALVRERLAARLGGFAPWEVLPPVAYGTEAERGGALQGKTGSPAPWLVTLVNLAATPEAETHGDWFDWQRRLLDSGAAAGVLLLADAVAYRTALNEADAGRRLGERLAAWRKLAVGHGFEMELVDDRPDIAETIPPVRAGDARPHSP